MKNRCFKVGFISLALALLGFIAVEIYHRSENTYEERMIRGLRSTSSLLSTLEAFEYADSSTQYLPFEEDIRGGYIKYPIGLLVLSGAFFLAGYLIGDSSGKKETSLE